MITVICLNSFSANYLVAELTWSTYRQLNNIAPSQIPTKKYLERHSLRQLHFHFSIIAG